MANCFSLMSSLSELIVAVTLQGRLTASNGSHESVVLQKVWVRCDSGLVVTVREVLVNGL